MYAKENRLNKCLILKLILPLSLISGYLVTAHGQTNQISDEPIDNPTQTITACEQWIYRVSSALDKWSNNKKASLIVIARLGDGETSRRINLKRIKTLKEYILSLEPETKMIFGEGERIKGDGGVIEIYVEGKLIDSLRVQPKSNIPLKGCNP